VIALRIVRTSGQAREKRNFQREPTRDAAPAASSVNRIPLSDGPYVPGDMLS
jgi:hypothetical protein